MKKAAILLAILFIMVELSSFAFAWAPQDQGKPEVFQQGKLCGYFIWHDHSGLHVLATTKGDQHVFNGVIHTNGKFVDVQGKSLAGNDFFTLNPDRDTIVFRFTTIGGADGIKFRVDKGSKINFDLFIDGYRINRQDIYIGTAGRHPKLANFDLPR